jgi:uncharacterized protein
MSSERDDAPLDIAHDAAARRFVARVDGVEAYVEYERDDGVLEITHTIVPREIGGRGIAGQLVRAAVVHARDAGLKLRTPCSYADAWLAKHPEFDALRADL